MSCLFGCGQEPPWVVANDNMFWGGLPVYIEYPSSVDSGLRLFAEFLVPAEPRRILVQMHGWHGQIKKSHTDNVDERPHPDWLVVRPEMRGRGDSTGKPDCNGWELQDVIDAVEFAKRRFADRVLDPNLITLKGGSGGGGNVFALVGKFPDYFCRARADCGISDYALWHRDDEVGEFRDELEGQGWIGGNPDTNAEAYASRGGATTAGNLLTPLIVFHGETDIRVPSEQSRRFVREAAGHGKGGLVVYHELVGVGTRSHWGNITPEQETFLKVHGDGFLGEEARVIETPTRGRFTVAGYLKTKRFEVVLDSIDRVAALDYDLDAGRFDLKGASAKKATIRGRLPDGRWEGSPRNVAVRH